MRWHAVATQLAAGFAILALLGGCATGAPTSPAPTPSPSPALVTPSTSPSPSPLGEPSSSPAPSADGSATSSHASSAPGSGAVPSAPAAASAAAWHRTGKLVGPHVAHTATLLSDGRVLVAGGKTTYGDDGKVSAAAELYDPISGTWTATGRLTRARCDHTATQLQDGRILVVGGRSGNGDQLGSAELYDPRSGRWTDTGTMHKVRSGHTATLFPDGRVLVTGGFNVKGTERAGVEGDIGRTTAELYDPDSGHWTTTASMTVRRAGHTATLLPDGRVLVAGGDRGEMDGGRSAELYDPSLGRWATTGSMTGDRSGHTATLLPDGKVLVTGGFAGSGYTVDRPCSGPPEPCSAELYDPATERWASTGRMHADRIGHTATLLADGTVLVVGLGTEAVPIPAELYRPNIGKWTATASPAKSRGLTATLLLDGRVLATGDFSTSSRVAELYVPGVGK